MRPAFILPRAAIVTGLLALGACAAQETPPEHVFAVFYANFATTLDAPGQAVVARAAAASNRFPNLPVTVTGYADPSDTTPAGVHQLAEARVGAVTAMLMADGVPASRIVRKPVGVPPNSHPGVESRRVEIDIGAP